MSKTDWYFVGFILAVIVVFFYWTLAVVVYRKKRHSYLNRNLSLSMLFMGFWILSGFVDGVFTAPNETFTLWAFRCSNAAAIMAAIFFLLFAIGLYLGRAPKRTTRIAIIMLGAFSSLLCLSPYVIRSVSFQNDILTSRLGPLYSLATAIILVSILGSIYLFLKKWSHSTGIDHARTSVILSSIVIFFPIAFVSVYVLPAITGNEIFTNYAYIAGILPVGFISYAIIRLRLLDVRIILRKTSVFIIGATILSIPLIALFTYFRTTDLNPWVENGVTLVIFIILVFLAPAIWRYIKNLSSRLFFSELYDELGLLDTVSSKLAAQADLQVGIFSVLSEITPPLGLNGVEMVIPPGVIGKKSWRFECSSDDDGNIRKKKDEDYLFIDWLDKVEHTVVTEELERWPQNPEEHRMGRNLSSMDLAACIPIKVAMERVGYLLVERKVSRKAISSTDLSVLEKTAERLGLFIDNYALSAQLKSQLEELEKVYREVHEAYKFNSEIIQVASHEFRTPTTVINGFAMTLLDKWDELEDQKKTFFLKEIINACKRITNLTDQCFRVSSLQEGNLDVNKVSVKSSSVLDRLCTSLTPGEQERIIIEAERDICLQTDPDHLHIILKNVLDNALRFSPVNESVIIRIWRTSMSSYIQIQDFGTGIPLEERERIFEPFVRLENLGHHTRGMGLGLHVVRLLSPRLGVEVEIESSEGSGTTVTLTMSL